MSPPLTDLSQRLPYLTPPLPKRRRWLRPAAYLVIALLFVGLIYQFQRATLKAMRKTAEAQAAGLSLKQHNIKQHRGAIGRWRREVQHFWRGQNIYLAPLPPGQHVPRPNDALPAKHPNMPFVLLLLTPFAYLSPAWTAITFNLFKLAALVVTMLMTVKLVTHRDYWMADYVALLGLLASVEFLIGDFQHGNTNVFVAAAVVGHLWAFRRGSDGLAGLLLALGICLKLTPALFLLYWLYQREWKVLAATAIALPLLILSPALFVGWTFYVQTISTWWNTLIYPGLVGGAWYPAQINQSLPGMIGRYFTGGDSGNFMFEPDDEPVPTRFGWITVLDLGPVAARWVLRVLQAAIVLLSAGGIGWRKLPRDDGRRGLHWGLVVSMMMLLNQRTWDHHAPPLIIAHFAIVYAAFHANLPRVTRRRLGLALLAAVAIMVLSSGDLVEAIVGESGADRVMAYGTAFWHFLIVWLLCLVAARKLSHLGIPYQPAVASQVQATPSRDLAGLSREIASVLDGR